MAILLGIFEEGLIYAIMALGVYITYKILDFPDLSVDGTFPLGAALTAGLIVKGISPVWALPLSFFAGVLAGCVTGFIHVKCKVRDLFSGTNPAKKLLRDIGLKLADTLPGVKPQLIRQAMGLNDLPEWLR